MDNDMDPTIDYTDIDIIDRLKIMAQKAERNGHALAASTIYEAIGTIKQLRGIRSQAVTELREQVLEECKDL